MVSKSIDKTGYIIEMSSLPSAAKMLRLLPATTCICLMLVILTTLNLPTSAASASTNVSTTSNQTSTQTSSSPSTASKVTEKTSSSKSISSSGSQPQQQQVTIVEQQQQQATDLSNMYVQIPIAEPGDTGAPDGVQQTLTGTVDGDSIGGQSADGTKATSWTGPWPKKFQIGYIKQSDLHQVLIESLKNDPFVSLSSPSGGATKSSAATTSAPQAGKKSTSVKTVSSDSSSLMSPQKTALWANNAPMLQAPMGRSQQQAVMNANHYHHQQPAIMHNFREAKQSQFNQMNRYHQNFNQLPRPFNQRQQQEQQQQFQKQLQQLRFAGFPSNSFKNQPVYTINNYPPEQLDPNNMQLIMPAPQPQFQSSARPQKSSEYYSSWRPVTSGDKIEQQQQQQVAGGKSGLPTQQLDYPIGTNDAFDDGFSSPSKDAVATGSMNRHPMLNSYIGSGVSLTNPGASKGAKLSPAMISAAKMKQQVDGPGATKTSGAAATKGATKGQAQPAGTKGQDSDAQLSAGRRRASNGTSTSTAAPSAGGSTDASQQTTVAPSTEADANSTASTTTSASTQSTTAESDTTDPDSVTLSEDDGDDSSTTTASPNGASSTGTSSGSSSSTTEQTASESSSSTTTTAASVQQTSQENGESEVATQGAGAGGTASLPSLTGNDEAGFTQASVQRSSTTGSSSTTGASGREETTPSSASSSTTSGETKGEVEADEKSAKIDSLSDEALLATSQKGADIAKTAGQRNLSSSSSKKTRSSERLQQPQPAASSSRKSASGSKGAKKASSSNRAAKQVAEGGSVKGASAKLSSGSQRKAGSSKKRAPAAKAQKAASQKSTRMVQSERLQQPQVVSMTAAQAQSTAQTLASLLLSRCMSSAGCAHLLDMCTTKQAIVPLPSSLDAAAANALGSSNSSAAWSVPVGLMSSSIFSLTQTLQADKALRVFPAWKDAIENVVDHDTQSGYTLILPSNEAIERLPEATVDSWLANSDLLAQIIDNHIIDSAEQIEFAPDAPKTRVIRSKGLQVNQHREKMVTMNGKRLVYANQAAPSGGRIHVIDGILDWPLGSGNFAQSKLLDIMDTLKQCDKFDGFVTLAEGTGLTQILKQDGPMTVFVPSNEALRKIPDEELEVIKNNSTALKEFLMYHVVNGSYFSQDLRDGQQLASILDMKPIQVGVRVDGCSRRLVEANTSPMRRPDIVAKNGVIHILDWYLTVRDNEWCDPIGRSTPSSTPTSNAPTSSTDRLQQLGSDLTVSYATRMVMPANHKPLSTALNEGPVQPVSLQKGSMVGLETNNIVVSATPLAFGEINRASAA